MLNRIAFAVLMMLPLSLTWATNTAPEPPLIIKNTAKPTIALPTAGMSMASVTQKFGAPKTKHAAIGKPPITQWDYEQFSVYFEYSHVVHSIQRMNLPEKVTVIIEQSKSP